MPDWCRGGDPGINKTGHGLVVSARLGARHPVDPLQWGQLSPAQLVVVWIEEQRGDGVGAPLGG